jgi:hypothetical protein
MGVGNKSEPLSGGGFGSCAEEGPVTKTARLRQKHKERSKDGRSLRIELPAYDEKRRLVEFL